MEQNKNDVIPIHIQKQLEWRNKQLHIMYGSGRPIFNYFEDKHRIFYNTPNGKRYGGYK